MALSKMIVLLACIVPFTLHAQEKDTVFKNEWIQIDTLLTGADLTRTALEKVNQLYKKADQQSLAAQKIKCLIYRYTLESRITEDDPNAFLKNIQREIDNTNDEAAGSILRTLLARQLYSYFIRRRWQLYGRSRTVSHSDTDVTTWNAADFHQAISTQFMLALQPSDLLLQTSLTDYDAVIIAGNSRHLRPTLYDLLVYEALDYFKSGESYIHKPVDPFILNAEKALARTAPFMETIFPVKDSSAPQWVVLQLYQRLLRVHRNDADKAAFLEANINRIEWVSGQGYSPGQEKAYREALEEIVQQYPAAEAAAKAWYLLARKEADKAGNYTPFGDTSNRYGYVRARQLIEQVLPLFSSNNAGTIQMQNLLAEIKNRELKTQTEVVNIPGKPFRALVRFRNIDTLFARIIRIDKNDSIRPLRWTDNWWKKNLELPVYKSFVQPLPAVNDHQLHATEVKIDALPVGEYALLCSHSPAFNDSLNQLSIQFFHVSGISYIKNNNDFFVLNRETGKPIDKVKVIILRQVYGQDDRNAYEQVATRFTDGNGYFQFAENRSSGMYRYIFTKGNDKLALKEPTYFIHDAYPAEDEAAADRYEKQNSRVFFFTDRSIYRPGQTISFKGIAVTKDHKTGHSKLITQKDSGWIYLRDVNRRKIDSLRFAVNDYGSFSGRFQLPQHTLTGNFSIELNRYNRASVYFSVEEYKRPGFHISFDKPAGAYRLNDSIRITGTAKAYAGNNIDGARLVYTVKRQTRFPNPWLWRGPVPAINDREISFGEMTTDAQGSFTIAFKALVDDLVTDRIANPLFQFTVSVAVTDANGETRNGSTGVTVGFSTLVLQIHVPAITMTDSFNAIGISATNLSNEKEPAAVRVRIFSLQAPDRLIRKRLWERPDLFTMSKQSFTDYFPTDEYEEESDHLTWQTGSLMAEGTIDTKVKDAFRMPDAGLQPGYYRVEAAAKDKYGEEITDIRYVQLFNAATGELPGLQYLFTHTIRNQAEPGQTASFISGSSVDEIFVISKTERPGIKKHSFGFMPGKKGLTHVNFTPAETDRGGVSITEAYVYNNRMYTRQYHIAVPWNNKQLKISYAVYRDKAEPGSQEKWTVTVAGNKGEKAAAELLTGMYDASLDQFKQHYWSIPDIWKSQYWRNQFGSGTNFTIEQSHENDIDPHYQEVPEQVPDRIAWDGAGLWTRSLLRWIGDSTLKLGTRMTKRIAAALKDQDVGVTAYAANRDTEMMGRLNNKAMLKKTDIAYDKSFKPVSAALEGAVAGVQIKGVNLINTGKQPLYILDGERVADTGNIHPDDIESIHVLNAEEATALYGADASGGAVVVTTKRKKTVQVQVRKHFNETAFFFPHLYADTAGNYQFSFTLPEALTQWKWMSIAYTKDLAWGSHTQTITTQKTLMVQPNAPRFMREGDRMEFSAKVVNLSNKELTGQLSLELVDATTFTSVDGWFQNVFPVQYFTAEAGQSTTIKFPIQIPFSYNRPLTWRVVVKAGNYSDGEENTLPVLTNRMLVTESLPLLVQKDTLQSFRFEKLLQTNSPSLTHESVTVEYSTNPVWYAVQSLPYLMEYPYECSEQIFNRFYGNALAAYITNRNPGIKAVVEKWKTDTSAFKSNLQKNEALKQMLTEETPWVLQAGEESLRKKNLARLFDMFSLGTAGDKLIEKLQQLQLPNGSFSWFKGGFEDRYMTHYILAGIGKLKRLGAITPDIAIRLRPVLDKAIQYADDKINEDYRRLIKNKHDSAQQPLAVFHIHYLYMRSFYRDMAQQWPDAYQYFYARGKFQISKQSTYSKALLGLVYYRNNEKRYVNLNILAGILENAVADSATGTLYWKERETFFWYKSPVEHQSMMIQFLQEVQQEQDFAGVEKQINQARIWLLLNKQTNSWKTTVATADACYALLLNGSNWLDTEKKVTLQLGNMVISSADEQQEAATGYFKKRIADRFVKPGMGDIRVTVQTTKLSAKAAAGATAEQPSWGSIYWQYFEDMDKITPAVTPLTLNKKLFMERNTANGKLLDPVKEGDELKTGTKVVIRLELRSSRDMEYLHLKDTRAAAMEPVNVLSGYKWQDGLGYYESTTDASTHFFISFLPKGTYVFEYPVYITHTGVYTVGIASIQSMYAPEFTSHSGGLKIRVAADQDLEKMEHYRLSQK